MYSIKKNCNSDHPEVVETYTPLKFFRARPWTIPILVGFRDFFCWKNFGGINFYWEYLADLKKFGREVWFFQCFSVNVPFNDSIFFTVLPLFSWPEDGDRFPQKGGTIWPIFRGWNSTSRACVLVSLHSKSGPSCVKLPGSTPARWVLGSIWVLERFLAKNKWAKGPLVV